MSLTSSMEDYLEAVLVLQKQKGYARCVDVSEFLGVTKPSVSRAVKELSNCLIENAGVFHQRDFRYVTANRKSYLQENGQAAEKIKNI